MSVYCKAKITEIKKVERMDISGAVSVAYQIKYLDHLKRKGLALVFYPLAQGICYLKPGDRVGLGITTKVYKWVNFRGNIDLTTENVIDYIERL